MIISICNYYFSFTDFYFSSAFRLNTISSSDIVLSAPETVTKPFLIAFRLLETGWCELCSTYCFEHRRTGYSWKDCLFHYSWFAAYLAFSIRAALFISMMSIYLVLGYSLVIYQSSRFNQWWVWGQLLERGYQFRLFSLTSWKINVTANRALRPYLRD